MTLSDSHNANTHLPQTSPGDLYRKLHTFTDLGNALRFSASFHQTVRYVSSRGWFVYSGSHWEPASSDTMLILARSSLAQFLAKAEELSSQNPDLCIRIVEHVALSESLPRLNTLLRLARTLPEMLLPSSALDADPYLLNLRNGTLDLRSGTLSPHQPEHYLTHFLPYDFDPSADASLWHHFLDRLTGSDTSLQLFLQRAVGSSLFGNSTESNCFLLTGPDQRTQQLFLSVLRQLLGSSSSHILSLQSRTLTPTLLTSRLLTLSSSTLLQSCDPSLLSAFIHHNPISLPASPDLPYHPHATLWLSAPDLPLLPEKLASLRDVLQPIPLPLTLSSYEASQLSAQLSQALPAILNWAIHGFQLWYTEAPPESPCLQQAATLFQEAQDPLMSFISHCCVADPTQSVPAGKLYEVYTLWAESNHEHPLSAFHFGLRIPKYGFSRSRSSSGRFYQGLTFSPAISAQLQKISDAKSSTTPNAKKQHQKKQDQKEVPNVQVA